MSDLKTCILQTHSEENEELFRLTLPNHAEYADRHGYDLISLHRPYRDMWWGIEDVVLGLSGSYDRIISMGSDVIFTRTDMPIEAFHDMGYGLTIQEEGLGYPTLNNDLIVWSGGEKAESVIAALRHMRPRYEKHRFGLQTGITLMARDEAMGDPALRQINVLKPRNPVSLQGHPFVGHESTWNPDDFAIHFLGLSNGMKTKLCRYFLITGDVLWMAHRECNLEPF